MVGLSTAALAEHAGYFNMAPGELELRLEDATGLALASMPLSIVGAHAMTPVGFFAAFVRSDERVRRVAVYKDGVELAHKDGSPHRPTASILAPTVGTVFAANSIARWHWADADGDSLSALVEYSGDEGQSWQIYGWTTTETRFR